MSGTRFKRMAVGGGAGSGVSVAEPGLGPEVVSLRTQYSDTYLSSAGAYVARAFPDPVNYRASDGSWQPIDDSLMPFGGGFVNRADAYRASLPGSGSGAFGLAQDGRSVTMQIQGASSASATVSGSMASYGQVLPGVSLSYQSVPGALKESLSLSSASVAPIRALVKLSPGLHLQAQAGTLLVQDDSGVTQFVMPQPVLEPATSGFASPPPSASDLGSVSVTVAPAVGGTLITYTPDPTWLAAPGRQFPVILDPSLSTTAFSSADCTISQAYPTSNAWCGYGQSDYVGFDSGNYSWRTMVSFTGGLGIPADSQVLGASLYTTVAAVAGGSAGYTAFAMSRSFTPKAATWTTYDGAHPWGSPGGDVTGVAQGSQVMTATGPSRVDLTPLVQSWIDGSNTVPTVMLAPLAGAGRALALYPGGYGTNSPYLQIVYAPRFGDAGGMTIDSTSLTDRMRLGVNVANGNLMVSNSDLQIKGTGLNQSVSRTYNNESGFPGVYGMGWGWAWAQAPFIYAFASDAVVLSTPDGGQTVWDTDPGNPGGYIAPPGTDASLCSTGTQSGCPGLLAGDSFQLTFRSGERWEFMTVNGCCPVLAADIDRNGNQISYAYGGPGGMASQTTDTQGRTTSFSYSGQSLDGIALLSSTTDNAGARTMRYQQNSSGQQTGYTDAAGNTTSYGYDANGNLTQVTDPAGEVTQLSYDTSGRISSVTRVTDNQSGTGDTTTYAYYSPQVAPVACSPPSGLGWYGETQETDPNRHTTTYCYDTHDRVFQTIDPYGYSTVDAYNTDDDVASSSEPGGSGGAMATTTASWDSCFRQTAVAAPPGSPGVQGGATETAAYPSGCSTTLSFAPSSTTDPQGNTLSYGYDTNANLLNVTDQLPSQNTLTVHHDLAHHGQVDVTTDPDGHQTSYGYDPAGNLTSVTPPSPLGASTTGYDAVSRPISQTDGKQQTTQLQYDSLDRLVKETHPDGSTTSYTYDPDGNLLKMADSTTGTSTYTYDLKNRLTGETSPGVGNSYTYDGADNLTSTADSGGTVTYGYDLADRLTSVQEPGVPVAISFSYDPDGRRTCTSYPNGTVVQNAYDHASNLLSIKAANGSGAACNPLSADGTPSGNVFASYVYTYSSGGLDRALRQTLTINGGNPMTYYYDHLDRLVEAAGIQPNGPPFYYSYDGAGNILSKSNPNGSTTAFTYNAANQITNRGYTYDPVGNELNRPDQGGTTALAYNARNQTNSINPDGTGAQALSYLGDGQAKPTQIGNSPPGGTAPTLENDELGISSQATAAQPGQQPSVTYYTRDTDGALLSERTPAGRYYYVQDANGSAVALTDASGNVANTYTYDPWGATISATESAPNSFKFDGGYQSNAGLYHFGQRYYDPLAGSWTQQDIVSRPQDIAENDRYAFAEDSPVTLTDPSGTSSWGACVAACLSFYFPIALHWFHACDTCHRHHHTYACADCIQATAELATATVLFWECIEYCNSRGGAPERAREFAWQYDPHHYRVAPRGYPGYGQCLSPG